MGSAVRVVGSVGMAGGWDRWFFIAHRPPALRRWSQSAGENPGVCEGPYFFRNCKFHFSIAKVDPQIPRTSFSVGNSILALPRLTQTPSTYFSIANSAEVDSQIRRASCGQPPLRKCLPLLSCNKSYLTTNVWELQKLNS